MALALTSAGYDFSGGLPSIYVSNWAFNSCGLGLHSVPTNPRGHARERVPHVSDGWTSRKSPLRLADNDRGDGRTWPLAAVRADAETHSFSRREVADIEMR